MSSTISGDFETSNLDAGPYWAMNSVWNKGNLVNGTDFTQSITSADPANPNMDTTISWNWPNTPAQYNVYSMPGVFYGNYIGFTAPTQSVTAEKIDNIQTLTLSQNLSYSGQTDHYDALYDMYLTSAPGGGTTTHEIEIDLHTPSYMQDWIKGLPQQHFTDANGMQWTIAENNSSGPPMVLFVPSDFQDVTNSTIDFKALLKAAEADGVLSGNEYFNGLGLGNEPQQGSGSMTINSFHVTYDGDPSSMGTTSGTGHTTTTTDPGTGTTTTPVSTTGTTTDNGGGTTTTTDGGGTMPGNGTTTASNGGGDTTTGHGSGTTTATDSGGTTTATDGGSTTTATDGGSTTTASDGGTTTTTDSGGTTTASDGGSTTTTGNGDGTQTASNGSGTTTSGNGDTTTTTSGSGHGGGCGGTDSHHSDHGNSNGGGHNIHQGIIALLHAMQQNNTTAVNTAVTTLGNDVHTASTADTGSSTGFAHQHLESFTHHFEHVWG